jgi:hypothetical protein
MTKIWIVEGEHMTVPGRPRFIFSDEKMAQAKAIELLNLIRSDWRIELPLLHEFGDCDTFHQAVEETQKKAAPFHGPRTVVGAWVEKETLIEPDRSSTTKPVCPKCGSDHIWIDAAARWNSSISDWSLSGTHDTLGC